MTSPKTTPHHDVELILKLREDLTSQGHDAGPETIGWHLHTHHQVTVSRAAIARTLTRAGLVTPEPKKKPKSAYIRFEADQPNAMWQSDFTHYRLADGTDIEIITWLDDHSRYALHTSGHQPVTGTAVVTTFRQAVHENGIPASTLTNNGMVERFQQTMKNWLRAQPPPATLTNLHVLLDTWRHQYNHQRPHRSLNRRTPASAYTTRPKSTPTGTNTHTHDRVRRDPTRGYQPQNAHTSPFPLGLPPRAT